MAYNNRRLAYEKRGQYDQAISERAREAETSHTPVKPLPLEEGGRSYPTIDNLDKSIDDLTQQISSGVVEGGKTRVTIAEFRPLVGNPTNFEKYLAEELITKMAKKGQFTVVERALLEKAHFSSLPYHDVELSEVDSLLKEHNIHSAKDVIEKSSRKLRKILGVDALVYGEVTEAEGHYALIYSQVAVGANARMIDARTEAVLWESKYPERIHKGGIPLSPLGVIQPLISAGLNMQKGRFLEATDNLCRSYGVN